MNIMPKIRIAGSRIVNNSTTRLFPHSTNFSSGFTLIEIIVSLVLVGIISAIAGMGLIQMAKGFVFARDCAATAQKAQIAMSRLEKEFSSITDVSSGESDTITYDNSRDDSIVVNLVAGNLSIDEDTLINNVGPAFSLTYYDSYDDTAPGSSYASTTTMIEINLPVIGADDIVSTFTNRVFLRDKE